MSEEYILPSVFDKQIVPKVAKAVAQAAIDSGEVVEQCTICHASGKANDVAKVHGVK